MKYSILRICRRLAAVAGAGVLLAMSLPAPSTLAASNKLNSSAGVGSDDCVGCGVPVNKLRGDLPYRGAKANPNAAHCHYVGWGGHRELVCD